MIRRHGAADDAMAGMMDRFGQAVPGQLVIDEPGPGLEAGAQLSVQVGRLVTEFERQRSGAAQQRAERMHAIFPFDFNPATIGLAGGAGTLASPNLFSPNEGYFWDVRKVTAASFTAGTVTLYKNAVNDANLETVFTSAGAYWFGSGQLILNSNDFLIFVAAGITGNVTVSGRAVQVRADYLADYLL